MTLASFRSLLITHAELAAAGLARHPRKLTAAVTLALGGFGATAFGIAPLMAEADNLPRRIVTESVTGHEVQTQLEALAAHDLDLHRGDVTRAGDTADSLLARLGIVDPAAAAFLRSDPTARRLLEGRSGKMVHARTDAAGALEELVARHAAGSPALATTHFSRLKIERVGGKFYATSSVAPLAAQVRLASGTIRSSLFAATDESRIPDAVASQLADMFGSDIDFQRELRRGDSFTVAYEALTADGEPVTWGRAAGRVLAAEFINKGRSHSAVWFADAEGKGGYYALDGRSRTGSFLASPMEFSRVTSGFAMRIHPIFNQWRQHRGVDYAAPKGTPVRSVGDGVVEFAGWQNGYGNVVVVRHRRDRETVYAHLSRIDVAKGERISQGQHLGAVGATGWATGPHLHFEFKVDGVHQNPAVMAQAAEPVVLSAADQARFAALAQDVRSQLAVAQTVDPASGQGE